MQTRTDIAAETGLHVFEKAGLGRAPFKVAGYFELKWQAHPGARVQAGGSCDYCGQGIMYAARIKAADGRTFKVGTDCVARTGDAGLIKAFKSHPDVRAMNRAKATAKDEAIKAEFAALMGNQAVRATLAAAKIEWHTPGKFRPVLEIAEGAWKFCGAAGRARYLKMIKHHLAKAASAA